MAPFEIPTGYSSGPWFVSGCRLAIDRVSFHRVARYDAERKQDEEIALVTFDPKTGLGLLDAQMIALAPQMADEIARLRAEVANLRAALTRIDCLVDGRS